MTLQLSVPLGGGRLSNSSQCVVGFLHQFLALFLAASFFLGNSTANNCLSPKNKPAIQQEQQCDQTDFARLVYDPYIRDRINQQLD